MHDRGIGVGSLRLLSSCGATYNWDMRVEHPDGGQHADVSMFTRD
jgi:hypothetical protein